MPGYRLLSGPNSKKIVFNRTFATHYTKPDIQWQLYYAMYDIHIYGFKFDLHGNPQHELRNLCSSIMLVIFKILFSQKIATKNISLIRTHMTRRDFELTKIYHHKFKRNLTTIKSVS